MPAVRTDMGIGSPQRKDKQILTFIPEQEQAIKYRFEFSLVGAGAKEFADKIVNSDIAEAYRPKVKTESPSHADLNSEQREPLSPNGGAEPSGNMFNQQHVLFHNVGLDISKTELARIRFGLIERFSDSVPVYQEPHSAANAAVILLFWNPAGEGRSPTAKTDFVAERLRDYSSRVAEVNFLQANCKPMIFLQVFKPSEEEERKLVEWHSKQCARGVKLMLQVFDDDQEDTMMDAMQEICERLVNKAARGFSKVSAPGIVTNTKCCIVS